jgi:hypothetical protein
MAWDNCQDISMFSLSLKSDNEKTGKMAVSTSPHFTCPPSCLFKKDGCYAAYGPISWWWKKISSKEGNINSAYSDFLNRVKEIPAGKCWRHNQAGDLIPTGICKDRISRPQAMRLVKANEGKRGFTYTHFPVIRTSGITMDVIISNRLIVEEMNANGFAVNISANSPSHADEIIASGIKAPITTVISKNFKENGISKSKTPNGRTIITCPATIKEGVTCLSCKMCLNIKRSSIIGFPAHGVGARYCEEIIK